jgi:hypothetical protein
MHESCCNSISLHYRDVLGIGKIDFPDFLVGEGTTCRSYLLWEKCGIGPWNLAILTFHPWLGTRR